MADRPGHVGTTGGGDEIEDTLRNFVGLNLADPATGFLGRLRMASRPNGSPFFWLDAGGNQRQIISSLVTARTLIDPVTRQAIIVQPGVGSESITSAGKLSEADLARAFGISTGTSGSAPSFASTQAAQTQAENFAREQAAEAARVAAEAAEAQRIFLEEQAEIDRELRLREARLSTARDLVNIKSAEAREARTQGISIAGDDPFTFTAISRGLAGPTGTTPSAAFKTNLAQAGSFQAPDLTGLDSNALESVIGKLSQLNTPQQTGPFGFAGGGVLSPSGAQRGTGAQAVPVGENGPEIMILRPDGSVEVVPMSRGAQTGGVFDFGGFPGLFRDLRSSVGVTNPQILQAGQGAASGFGSILQSGVASQLGARQIGFGALVKTPSSRQVFLVTESGLRPITTGSALAPLGGDVRTLSEDQFARLDIPRGADIGFEEARRFTPTRREGAFGAFGEPLTARGGLRDLAAAQPGFSIQDANRIGQLIGFLPAPHKIPPAFFNSLAPTEQTALLSAYRLAGVPEADFTFLRTGPQLPFSPQRATAVG